MSIDWLGIQRRTSPIDPRPAADLAVNNNYSVKGEIRRRAGMAATNVPKQAGPVLNIAPPIGPSGGIIVFPTGGEIFGYQDPRALWDDAKVEPPQQDNSWGFPPQPTPAAWILPDGHTGGTVKMSAFTLGTTISMPEGRTFQISFDTVPVYVSVCVSNGVVEFSVPPGVTLVEVFSSVGCGPGTDPTMDEVWAESVVLI